MQAEGKYWIFPVWFGLICMHWGGPWEGYKPGELWGTTVDGEYKAAGFWGAKELDAGLDGRKGLTVGLDGGRKGEASSGYAI